MIWKYFFITLILVAASIKSFAKWHEKSSKMLFIVAVISFVVSIGILASEDSKSITHQDLIKSLKVQVKSLEKQAHSQNEQLKDYKKIMESVENDSNFISSEIINMQYKNSIEFQLEKSRTAKHINSYLRALFKIHGIKEKLPESIDDIPIFYAPLITNLASIQTNKKGESVFIGGPKINDERADRLFKEAVASYEANNLEEAVVILDRIPQITHFSEACITGATIYSRAGKDEKAKELMERAIELDPLNPKVTSGIGNIFHYKNDYGNAVFFYEKTIDLIETTYQDEDIKQRLNVALLNLAIIYDFNDVKKRAYVLLKQFLKTYDTDDSRLEYAKNYILQFDSKH